MEQAEIEVGRLEEACNVTARSGHLVLLPILTLFISAH